LFGSEGFLRLCLAQIFSLLQRLKGLRPELGVALRSPDVYMALFVAYELLFTTHSLLHGRRADRPWHVLWHRALAGAAPPVGAAVFSSPVEPDVLPAFPSKRFVLEERARCEEAWHSVVGAMSDLADETGTTRGLFSPAVLTLPRWRWCWALQAQHTLPIEVVVSDEVRRAVAEEQDVDASKSVAASSALSKAQRKRLRQKRAKDPIASDASSRGTVRGRLLLAPAVWALPFAGVVPGAAPCRVSSDPGSGTFQIITQVEVSKGQPLALEQAHNLPAHRAVAMHGILPPTGAEHTVGFPIGASPSDLEDAQVAVLAAAAGVPADHWPPEAVEISSMSPIHPAFMGVARAVVATPSDVAQCESESCKLYSSSLNKGNEVRALRRLATQALSAALVLHSKKTGPSEADSVKGAVDEADAATLLARKQFWDTLSASIEAAEPDTPRAADSGLSVTGDAVESNELARIPSFLGERALRAAQGRGMLLRKIGFAEVVSGARLTLAQFAATAQDLARRIESAEVEEGDPVVERFAAAVARGDGSSRKTRMVEKAQSVISGASALPPQSGIGATSGIIARAVATAAIASAKEA
jgi:hypothetical protein